ncbi:hypothetical protein HMPREF1624_02419 [Sporothrix schenckii ATCC 58251]|uniref:Uncharacterized protein n=1 Tax=Sporothrix schenckii (strain ATCC 58251 / de Perez 2211183) TaxID=1391915 RepID=U7Q1W2_SPOS1|nr:hypothetical protein HMPREF1624_02419 [Sporothrix schenckii ATCC 58251]
MKAIAAGAILATGAMAAPTDETSVSLIDNSVPTPTTVGYEINATSATDSTDSWTKVESVDAEIDVASVVVDVTLPLTDAENDNDADADADANVALAIDWSYWTDSPDTAPDVKAAAAAAPGAAAAPATPASAAPANPTEKPVNMYPNSYGEGLLKGVKSIFDFLTGRSMHRAHKKAKADYEAKVKAWEAAKAKAEEEIANNAQNVSEEWTMDDPDYDGDSGEVVEVVEVNDRRARFFQA